MSLSKDLCIRTCEMHTVGQAARIIIDGYPKLEGDTVMQRRMYALNNYDHIRKFCMMEPRGHSEMYGALLVKPSHPDAHVGAIYMDGKNYATMCGHATIALTRYALDHGLVPEDQRTQPETEVIVEAPCGLVRTFVEFDGKKAGRARFQSVPSFAFALDVELDVPEYGQVRVDIGFGGAFYAFLPAATLGLDLKTSRVQAIIAAGRAVTDAAQQQVKLHHPDNPNMPCFIYGAALTDGKDEYSNEPMAHVVIYSGQADRSPCGSGTTARIALQHAKGQIGVGQVRLSQGALIGSEFTAKVLKETTCGDFPAVTVEVSGKAYYMGSSTFTLEEDDPHKGGFLVG